MAVWYYIGIMLLISTWFMTFRDNKCATIVSLVLACAFLFS